jgi:hypothetical protein
MDGLPGKSKPAVDEPTAACDGALLLLAGGVALYLAYITMSTVAYVYATIAVWSLGLGCLFACVCYRFELMAVFRSVTEVLRKASSSPR